MRSGIYKDTVFSSNVKTELYLRPNICLAISIAPELFPKDEAHKALAAVECYLIEKNSLGVKTLDPEEAPFNPNYERDTDCTNPKIALGFNKHNGPEWVFLYGFFLKALIEMNKDSPHFKNERLMSYLTSHKQYIKTNEWLSLPGVTNSNG